MARVEACCCSSRVPTWEHVPHPEAASHLGSSVLIIAWMPAREARAVLQCEEEALHRHLVKFKLKPACGWLFDSLPVGKKGKRKKLFLYK